MAAAVQRVLRRGLPVTPSEVGPALLGLRGVIARAVDPNDDASRTAALEGVLRGVLVRFGEARHAEAVQALFGLPPAAPGQNLTVRRGLAAAAAGYEVHHFRKRVEPRLIQHVAWALLADADRFTRSRMIAPRLAPTGERHPVPADPFAWEVAEHEEALSRLWSAIYALRAELLAAERLTSLDADRQEVIRQAVTAAWQWALASTEATRYATAFGPSIADESEASAHDLVALAGWTPPLSPEQAERLRDAAAEAGDRAGFVARLSDETALGSTWIDAFLTPAPRPCREVLLTKQKGRSCDQHQHRARRRAGGRVDG